MAKCPRIERCLLVDGSDEGGRMINLDAAVAGSRYVNPGRGPRYCHALFLRYDGASEGHFAPIAGKSAGAAITDYRQSEGDMAFPRRRNPSPAGTAVPRRTVARCRSDDSSGLHCRHYGALRSRAILAPCRALPSDAQRAGTDDDVANAQTAR